MASVLHGIQTELVARLQAVLPSGVRVMSAFDLDAAKDRQIIAPAVFVTFEGVQVLEYSAARLLARADVSFSVVAVARQGAAITQGEAAGESALGLLESVIGGLTGFKPTKATKAMTMQSADAPEYTPPMAWLPSAWSCEAMLPTTP